MQYEVADTKAGKRGRCPTCGAPIHVPSLGEAGSAYHKPRQDKHLSHMIAWTAVSVIAALLLLTVVLALREEDTTKSGVPVPRPPAQQHPGTVVPAPKSAGQAVSKPPSVPEAPTGSGAADASTEKRSFLVRFVAEQLGEYRSRFAHERRLRARDILRKSRNNEWVEPDEYALRRKVMGEATALANEGQDTSKWKLEEPLSDEERKELANLSTALQTQSIDLQNEFIRLGFRVATHSDMYGRQLIDVQEAEAKLDALLASFSAP
jgi:hypothetical protein